MAVFLHCSVRALIPELAEIITLDLLGNIDSFLVIFRSFAIADAVFRKRKSPDPVQVWVVYSAHSSCFE
jgi:hypothetical protein